MSSNGWGSWRSSSKTSQLSLDLFEQWKKEQNKEIGNRGQSGDPTEEEDHNRFMLRQNLNAYVCHKELDTYTACLEDKHLIHHDASGGFELNMKNKANEKLCKSSHRAYMGCMSSQQNQEAVLQQAAMQTHCTENRFTLFRCMEENKEVEAQTHEPQCTAPYRGLLRCGLNHLWNEYWRAITQFGDSDEFHLYELSRDENKKQEYLRVSTTTVEQQREFLRKRSEMDLGYYTNPPQEEGK